jgi:hypothetical protein
VTSSLNPSCDDISAFRSVTFQREQQENKSHTFTDSVSSKFKNVRASGLKRKRTGSEEHSRRYHFLSSQYISSYV